MLHHELATPVRSMLRVCGDRLGPEIPRDVGHAMENNRQSKKANERKVQRGSAWSSAPERCRSASRIGRQHATYRGCSLGFHVVLE